MILWSLLFYWQLAHVMPDLRAHCDDLAMRHWYGDAATLAQPVEEGFKPCASSFPRPYGRPDTLSKMLEQAIQWFDQSATIIVTGHT